MDPTFPRSQHGGVRTGRRTGQETKGHLMSNRSSIRPHACCYGPDLYLGGIPYPSEAAWRYDAALVEGCPIVVV